MTQHHQTPPALKPLPRLAKIFLVLAIAVFHSSSQRTMINFKARKQIAQGWNLQGQDGWEPNRTTSSPVFGCGVCDSNAQRHIQNSEPDAPVTCNFMSVMIPFSGVSWPNDLFRWVQCRSIVANHLQHFMFADVNMSQYIAGEYTSWCFIAVYLYNLQSLNTFQRHVSLCNGRDFEFPIYDAHNAHCVKSVFTFWGKAQWGQFLCIQVPLKCKWRRRVGDLPVEIPGVTSNMFGPQFSILCTCYT